MKCVVTGENTTRLTKNVPLSKKGKDIIEAEHKKFNNKLKTKFIEEQLELNKNHLTKDYLEKIAPKVSKNTFIKMVSKDGLEEIFNKLESLEKNKNNN